MAYNPQYKINVINVFDKAYASYSKEFRSKIRPVLSNPEFRMHYTNLIIDRIQQRTESGIDKKGKSLGTYATSYEKTLPFKIYKKGQTRVNLKLTGEMLSSIVDNVKRQGEIILEFIDQTNKDKAYGHITGFEGHPHLAGKVQPRDFFGLPPGEEVALLKEAIKTIRSATIEELVDISNLGDVSNG